MDTRMNFLSIPLRKPEPVNLYSILKNIIDNEFYQSSSSFDSNLNEINTLRMNIVNIPDDPKMITIEHLGFLTRYYVQLNFVELKFPSDSIEFEWSGKLNEENNNELPLKLASIEFEKLNLLFNLGCVYSKLAIKELNNSNNEESLKKACIFFQYSAGCFEYSIKLLTNDQSHRPNNNYPNDLKVDTLLSLKFLMFAQAQETFWLKAVKGNLKDTVVAKLSIQVSDYYKKSWEYANKSFCYNKDWIDYLEIKGIHFECAAYYRIGLNSNNNGKFGDGICYLRHSFNLIKNVRSFKATSNSKKIMNDAAKLETVLIETLKTAERENNLIYMQIVPNSIYEVTQLAKASMVKPLVISQISQPIVSVEDSAEFGQPLFKGLIPFKIIQVSNSFKERISNFVKINLKVPLESLNNEIDTQLNQLNIISQIDSILKPQSIPNSIIDNYERLKSMNGLSYLNNLSEELNNFKLKSRQELNIKWDILNAEKAQDEKMLQFYGSNRWKSPSNERDNKGNNIDSLTNQLNILENYLKQSKNGDEIIFNQINDLKPYLKIYETEENLVNFLPNSKILDLNPDLKELIFQLNEKIQQLKSLQQERVNYINEVSIKANKIELTPLIIHQYNNTLKDVKDINDDLLFEKLEPILTDSLSRNFDSDLKYLITTKSNQLEQFNSLQNSNNQFQSKKQMLKKSKKREESLTILNETMNGFLEIVDNLKQGLQFYQDFLTSLSSAGKEIDEFLAAKRDERYNLQKQLDEMDNNVTDR